MKEMIITQIPDQDLIKLAQVKQKFDMDGSELERNIIDEWKNYTVEQVKQQLKESAFPYAVCFENWIGDFNFSTGVRNANAFNAECIYYIGRKRWDKRGAVGTYVYKDVIHLSSEKEILSLKEKYTFIGIDNIPGSIPMKNFSWPKNSLMIFGEEGKGLSKYVQSLCDQIVYIEQFGSVRSVNCGTASGITMVDFVNKYRT